MIVWIISDMITNFITPCLAVNTFVSVYLLSLVVSGLENKYEGRPSSRPVWRPTMYRPQVFNLFVYGKLKKDEINNYWLTNPENGLSKFIGMGQTVKRYPMIIGKYKTPVLMDSPGKGHKILGEIYLVDTFMLKNLDMLEGVPVFNGRKMDVIRMFSEEFPKGKEMLCWFYYAKVKPIHMPGMNYVSEYNSRNIPEFY